MVRNLAISPMYSRLESCFQFLKLYSGCCVMYVIVHALMASTNVNLTKYPDDYVIVLLNTAHYVILNRFCCYLRFLDKYTGYISFFSKMDRNLSLNND